MNLIVFKINYLRGFIRTWNDGSPGYFRLNFAITYVSTILIGCAFKSLTNRLTDKPLECLVEGSCEVYESVRNMLHALKKESLKNAKKSDAKICKRCIAS